MGWFLTVLYVVLTYLSPSELLPALTPYRIMVWVAVLALAGTVMAGLSQQFSLRAPQLYLALGFLGSAMLSKVVNGWFGGAIMAAEGVGTSLIIVALVAVNANSLRRMRWLTVALVLVSLQMVVRGILAYHFGYDEQKLVVHQWAGEGLRMGRLRGTGFLADPNDLAQHFLLILPFLGLFYRPGRWVRNVIVVALPAAGFLYAIFLTGSRGGLIGLALLIWLSVQKKLGRVGSILATIVVVVLLLALNFSGGRAFSMSESSAADRLEAWGTGLRLFKSAPILGIGYKSFTDYHERTAHNSFVLCLTETGLVGYFFWLALVVVTIQGLRSLARTWSQESSSSEHCRWAQAVQLAFYTFLATSWFLSRTYVASFFLLVGFGVALAEMERKKPSPSLPGLKANWILLTVALELATVVVIYATLRARGL